MALDTAIDIDAIIYPDNWPTCPAGCQREDDSGPQELDLLVERDTGSVEASVHCALCGLDRPASALGFRAGAWAYRMGYLNALHDLEADEPVTG